MRNAIAVLLGLLGLSSFLAQAAVKNTTDQAYGIVSDHKTYPQSTPQETLASVIKAIEAKRVNYLLAHLADSDFVERRLKSNGGRFKDLVQEATDKLSNDPGVLKQLRRFLKEGTWTSDKAAASVQLKDVKDRSITFRKIKDHWFMRNQYRSQQKKGER